jgi:ATP-binding cassette subfamily B protein
MSEKMFSADRAVARHFWAASLRYKRGFYLSFLTPVNAICMSTLVPFAVGKILASLLVPHAQIKGYVIFFIIAAVASFLTNYIGYTSFMRWQAKIQGDLQAECLNMLLKRGTSFHNNQVSGKLVSDAIDYPNAYGQLATVFFTQMLPFVFALVSGLVVITVSSPILGLLIGAMTIFAIASGVIFRQKMTPFRHLRVKRSKAVTGHFADTIVNIQAVKTFAREKDEMKAHRKLGEKLKESRTHDWVLFSKQGSYRIAAVFIFQLVFIMVMVSLVRHDPTQLGTGIFAFAYTITLTNRLFEVTAILRAIDEAMVLAEPIALAMQEKAEVEDIPDASELHANNGGVVFDKISFHYDDSTGEQNVFTGLDLSIKPGEKIGLVGPSGGGKSTITRLLLRFEDVQEGSVMIDGQDIAQVTQTSLRRAIAYVPQESLLFHRSIAENIAYGNLDASEAAVIKAAKAAYAHDFIMELPDRYETIVGERGVKLSGGQRQRIAIARAMLKDAPILLLDEATSALDSESEKVIQEALHELMEHRTAIVIAHRLSTIQEMDRIVVLDKGKIVEDGSHTQLLKKKGLYARLWARQSGGFIEA